MIRRLIILALVLVSAIIGVGVYLQPDELNGCDSHPGLSDNCQFVDAIIAISGGDTGARASQAIKLYKNGWARTLIFSGGALDKTGPSNAAVMKNMALQAGVPEAVIFIDEKSESTKQNAENIQTIFYNQNVKTAILVTSGYHQRRAILTFEKYTYGVTIKNHPVLSDKDWSSFWWITPRGWWLASSEIIKIIIFNTTGIS